MSAVLIALPQLGLAGKTVILPSASMRIQASIIGDFSLRLRLSLFLPVANNGSYIPRGDHYRMGSSSPSMVGMSSDTVGWIGMSRCNTV